MAYDVALCMRCGERPMEALGELCGPCIPKSDEPFVPDLTTPLDRAFRVFEAIADDPRGRRVCFELGADGSLDIRIHGTKADAAPEATRRAVAGTRWFKWQDGPITWAAFVAHDPHLTDAQWLARGGS